MEDRSSEVSILNKIAIDIGTNHNALPSASLTGFMAMVGHLYDGELMVVGRAVNGWMNKGREPISLQNQEAAGGFTRLVLDTVTTPSLSGAPCPMRWVSDCWGNYDYDYNTRRSAFWRVIRRTVAELHIADAEEHSWPSHLVWSNLYKMAPFEGGNPSSALCSIQFDRCKTLLSTEIAKFSPKRLLFLSGDWTWPFIDDIMNESEPVHDCHYVEGVGTIAVGNDAKCRTVVAAHPQGKKESMWVDEVTAMLR